MELMNSTRYTKEQLINHAERRNEALKRMIVDPAFGDDCHDYYRQELVVGEIVLAVLANEPVGYINRLTGAFAKPEWLKRDDLDQTLYFPLFGSHLLKGGRG